VHNVKHEATAGPAQGRGNFAAVRGVELLRST
jgi:hypothetical protein